MKTISEFSRACASKGFTLIEVMVVVGTVIILAAIGTTAYVQQQNRATSEKGKGIAEVILSGAEKYYEANGEYPLSSSLTTVDSAATAFSTTADSLQGAGFTFYGCNGACSSSITSRFYYVTRLAQTTVSASANNLGPCTVILNSNGTDPELNGASMFFVAYYDPFTSSWVYKKGENGPGPISISGAGCAFS